MMGRQEDGRRYRGAPYRGSSGMFVYPPIKFVDNHKKQKTNHSIWKGMKMAVDNSGFLGLFKGGFTACAVGVSAALVFGYIASWIFEPKMKKK